MDKNTVFNEIISYVQSVTNLPVDKIPTEESLYEKGLMDSYAIIELIDFLENQFKVSIKDNEITKENLGSISKMTNFVMAKK